MYDLINCAKRSIALRQMAKFFSKIDRNPVTRTPAEVDLEFQEIDFKSTDGLNLKAWYMPSKGSSKIVVFNHFMLGNRAGAVPLADWGNVTVDFMPIYRALVDAGYSIFTYDLRNHGESDQDQGGMLGLTHTEYQDALGAQRYVKEHYPDSEIFLYSQCYGTVATMRAMDKSPADFEGVKAFVNIQPLSSNAFVEGVTEKFGLSHPDNVAQFSKHLKRRTGYSTDELKVPDIAPAVKMPTMLVQVRADWRTTNKDLVSVFEKLGTDEKEMLWIDDQEERLEAYNHFARHPDDLITFFNKY